MKLWSASLVASPLFAVLVAAGGPAQEQTLNAPKSRAGSHLVTDAVEALHFTEEALRDSGAKADAEKLRRAAGKAFGKRQRQSPDDGGVVIESDSSSRAAELERLRSRLDRLEKRFSGNEPAADEGRQQKLEAVRSSITSAGERVDELLAAKEKDKAVVDKGIDIDSTIVPYPGAVEQFGSEDQAENLTQSSVQESNGMIDSIEKAQAVESKRAVNRALTHLRGATITAYDGIAHGHLANVDRYAKEHHWRSEHAIRHLAEEEADVERWAFPVPASKASSPLVAAPAPAAVAPAAPAPAAPPGVAP